MERNRGRALRPSLAGTGGALLVGALVAALPAGRAPAAPPPGPGPDAATRLFFGEDLNGSGEPLGRFPIAEAARTAFVAAAGRVETADLEGDQGTWVRLRLGPVRADVDGLPGKDSVSTPGPGRSDRRATSARRYYEHGSDALVLRFDRPVTSFGFYGIDVGDAGGRLRVTLGGPDGDEEVHPVPHTSIFEPGNPVEGAILFFGVVRPDRPFTWVELRNAGDPGDGFGYDDLVVGFDRDPFADR